MIRVGITSVGGVTANVFIKSLKLVPEEEFYIVGFDADRLAYGFKFVDKGYCIPPASQSKDYLNTLLKICKSERLNLLIPLMDEEMMVLANVGHRFEKVGCKLAISPRETLLKCLDKLTTYEALGSDIFARTIDATQYNGEFGFPVILKPRMGRGSRDTYVCYNEEELRIFKKRIRAPIIQEFLYEPEYTVDVFSDISGKALIAIPRRRIKVKGGVTWQGVIERVPKVEELVKLASEKLGIRGPSCIQLRYDNEKQPKIFEVNPRIGGTTILSVLAGINIPYLTVKLFLDGTISLKTDIEIKRLYISRYFSEVLYDEEELLKRGDSNAD